MKTMDGMEYSFSSEPDSVKTRYGNLDSYCVPMVEWLNSIGLKTKYLCHSHHSIQYGVSMSQNAYIMFSDDVTDDDIDKFLKRYNFLTGQCRIVSWPRVISGSVSRNYEIEFRLVRPNTDSDCEKIRSTLLVQYVKFAVDEIATSELSNDDKLQRIDEFSKSDNILEILDTVIIKKEVEKIFVNVKKEVGEKK